MEREHIADLSAELTEACRSRGRSKIIRFPLRRTSCPLLKDTIKGREMAGKNKDRSLNVQRMKSGK